MGDEDAPTGVAPTELGAAIDETEAVTAWSLDGEQDEPPTPRLTPGRITALAVAGALVVIAIAGVVATLHLRSEPMRSTPPTPLMTEGKAPPPPMIITSIVPPPTQTVTVERPAPPRSSRAYPTKMVPPETLAAWDRQFLASLQAQGWIIRDAAQTTRRAHQVCAEFHEHASMNDIMARLAAESNLEPQTAWMVAEQFAYTALEVYPLCERG